MTLKKTLAHQQTTLLESRQGKFAETAKLEPYLIMLTGLDQGKQICLHRQLNTFGRSDEVDIKINDAMISRRHGVFVRQGDNIVLEDFDSTNGTYVNNIRIKRQVVESITRIRVGQTVMKIEYKNVREVESETALYEAANFDGLTHVYNRGAFMKRAKDAVQFHQNNNGNLALIMCDLDFFKQTNDNFGHQAGDYVLKKFTSLLRMEIQEHDILARYGGEEFIMLLRNSDPDKTIQWAESIRQKIQQFDFTYEGKRIMTTVSIGVCCKKGDDIPSLTGLIKAADKALYRAKNKGRNRVELV